MIDSFFKKNDIEFIIKLKTKEKLPISKKCFSVEKDIYIIYFQHSENDGIEFLKKCINYNIVIEKNCCSIDFFWKNFFHYYRRIYTKPFFDEKIEKLSYHNFSIEKKDINFRKSLYFSALLCYTFWKKTNASFCKLQIIHYLPWITEKNKIFSDILIVPLYENITWLDIYNFLLQNHKTKQELWEIYKKFYFFSKFYPVEKISPNFFDISLSYIPFSFEISDFSILSKSLQFDKISACILRNKNNYFCSIITENSISPFSTQFQENLITF